MNAPTIDLAKKIGFALTCKLNLVFEAHDAMLEDRYSDALIALDRGGKTQIATELRFLMRRFGV